MKSILKVVFVVFLISLPVKGTPFSVGDHTGNGGDVVICKSNAGNQLSVLDYYEVSELHFLKVKPFKGKSVDEIVKEAIDRSGFSSWDKEKYKKRAGSFMMRVSWSQQKLPDIRDSYHTYLPPHCEINQIAINKLNGTIIVNKKLWDQLDTNNKAALIFHELVYEDLIFSGYKDSILTRMIVSHAIADEPVKTQATGSVSRFYEFLWEGLGTLSPEQKRFVLRYSPLLKGYAFQSLIHLELLDYETQQIALDIAKTEYFSTMLLSLRYAIHKYGDFVYDFLITGIKNLKYHQYIAPQNRQELFYAIRNTAKRYNDYFKTEELFLALLDLYDFDVKSQKFFNEGSYLELFYQFNFFTDNQAHVERILAPVEKLLMKHNGLSLFKFTAEIPEQISIQNGFIEKYYDFLKSLTDEFTVSPWGIPHPATYRFFVRRALYLDSMIPLFKKFVNDKMSTQDDFNYPYRWFLEDQVYKVLAEELKPELREAALHYFQISELRKNLVIYYGHFKESLDPLHRQALLNHFYQSKRGTFRREVALNILFEDYGQRDEEVQNAYAYGLRFEREVRYGKKRYLSSLKQFPHFSEFTYSVLYWEMRKEIQNELYLLSLMELFQSRPLTEDVRAFVFFLKDDPREAVRLAAEALLAIQD